MSRRTRLHLTQGTYYVVRRSCHQRPAFLLPEDYALMEWLLPTALKRAGAQLHGYCWIPDAMHLVVTINVSPLGALMRELTSRYAREVLRRRGERGSLFSGRYQATLIDPNIYLVPSIHYVHYVPVLVGLSRRPEDHAHSSHRAYAGGARTAWLHTDTVLQLLGCHREDQGAYHRLVASPPHEDLARLLEYGRRETPGILGGPEFISGLPRRIRPARSALSLDEIAGHVCRIHEISHAQLVSRSRRRRLVLARALIAWYATERGIVSLNQAARYLRHSASGLTRGIVRYQTSRPDLFTLSSFASLTPLVPRASRQGSVGFGQDDVRDQRR